MAYWKGQTLCKVQILWLWYQIWQCKERLVSAARTERKHKRSIKFVKDDKLARVFPSCTPSNSESHTHDHKLLWCCSGCEKHMNCTVDVSTSGLAKSAVLRSGLRITGTASRFSNLISIYLATRQDIEAICCKSRVHVYYEETPCCYDYDKM